MTSPTTLTPLGGLHFLIHPFYDASAGTSPNLISESEYVAAGRPQGTYFVGQDEIDGDLERYPLLAEAYVQRAMTLEDDEVLAAFLPQEESALAFVDRRFETMYLGMLISLRTLLGDRLALFYRDSDPLEVADAPGRVKKRLERLGWSVTRETPSYAYGETVEECIPRAVRALRREFGFRRFTRVPPLFTDLRFAWPAMNEKKRGELRAEARRFGIVLRD